MDMELNLFLWCFALCFSQIFWMKGWIRLSRLAKHFYLYWNLKENQLLANWLITSTYSIHFYEVEKQSKGTEGVSLQLKKIVKFAWNIDKSRYFQIVKHLQNYNSRFVHMGDGCNTRPIKMFKVMNVFELYQFQNHNN